MRTTKLLALSLLEVPEKTPFRRYIAFQRAVNAIAQIENPSRRGAMMAALGPYEGRGHGKPRQFVRSMFSLNAQRNSRSKYEPCECDRRRAREFARYSA